MQKWAESFHEIVQQWSREASSSEEEYVIAPDVKKRPAPRRAKARNQTKSLYATRSKRRDIVF